MKNKLVTIQPLKTLIQPTGWAKKGLAEMKLDLTGLCGFGCTYCSSSTNRYHGVNARKFAAATLEQLGEVVTPISDPSLSYVFPDVAEQLKAELEDKSEWYGEKKTLAFGCLTDNLAPYCTRAA